MEKLLAIAEKASDHAEIFFIEENRNEVSFENAKLKNINSYIQSGLSLRVIKDNRSGFSYTKNLTDREELLQNALSSLNGGVEAPLSFPKTNDLNSVINYDSCIESVLSKVMVNECQRICKILAGKTTAQLNIDSETIKRKIKILNTNGTNLTCHSSYYYIAPCLLYPGSYSKVYRSFFRKSFEKTHNDIIDFICNIFSASEKEASLSGGRMKVLFLPESIYALMWRLTTATSGKILFKKQSPLENKIDEKIFDEKLTIFDNPLNDTFPGARTFDDEGTTCSLFHLVEEGVLKNFYYDLFYAKKLGAEPTGHGYRSAIWGGETVAIIPEPSLEHLFIKTGELSFGEMIEIMDRGIVVGQVLGAHSGNTPIGDYSFGLSPGFYVENGEIIGHVRDVMVTGNIYDSLKRIVAVENMVHYGLGGNYPAILVNDVNVVVKKK